MTSASGARPLVTWTRGPVGGAELDGRRRDLAVAHDQDGRPALGARERLERHAGGRPCGPRASEVDARVHAGLQQVLRVGDVDLHAHRPGARVERVDDPRHLAGELPARDTRRS